MYLHCGEGCCGFAAPLPPSYPSSTSIFYSPVFRIQMVRLGVTKLNGLPTPLKQLAQLHNVNNVTETPLSWQDKVTLMQYDGGGGIFLPGNFTEVLRLQSTAWLARAHEGIGKRKKKRNPRGELCFQCDGGLGWEWLSEAVLWQWDNKSGGENTPSLAANVGSQSSRSC